MNNYHGRAAGEALQGPTERIPKAAKLAGIGCCGYRSHMTTSSCVLAGGIEAERQLSICVDARGERIAGGERLRNACRTDRR